MVRGPAIYRASPLADLSVRALPNVSTRSAALPIPGFEPNIGDIYLRILKKDYAETKIFTTSPYCCNHGSNLDTMSLSKHSRRPAR